MADLKNIKEQVEQKLQSQQANKEFKDIGRVAQTRKEKSAYKLINGSILNQLEEDGIMAYNMVKKENVWPEINIEEERMRGVTAGAAFLKVKIREGAPTRPKDEKAKRATYVLFLELLQKDLLECFNVGQIKGLKDKYESLPIEQVIGYFIDPKYLTADEETKNTITESLKKNTNIRVAMMYGSRTFIKKLVNEVFSARFENILFKYSDAANIIWHEASEKEPITQEESTELLKKAKERRASFNEANEKLRDEAKVKSKKELLIELETKWSITGESKKFYKNDIEKFREFVISYYDRRIKIEASRFDEKEKSAMPRSNDWSWHESPKEKTESDKPKAQAINTKAPLEYIKRTGGYKIDDITPAVIIEKFGFSAVNYGVYVDDAWSKEHTKHFLGAMADLGDILNINIKDCNQLGKLSIAFGAKGRKGHAAAYFPQTKDINLTRGNGDGSVAHEWGHYFDNVIVELDKKAATNQFASEGGMQDFEIQTLFKELMTFYYKGNPLYTPKVPMRFYPQKRDEAPTFSRYIDGGWKSYVIEIKDTIEETLVQLDSYAIVDEGVKMTQYRLFGYIIDKFNLPHYDIPLRLRTSYVYHKSAYNSFQYSGNNERGQRDIIVWQRSKYWTSAVELFARAWETVILKKFMDSGRVSTYLVNDIPMEDIISESYYAPYPAGKELEFIETIIDKIIIAVKKKFNIGNFMPPSNTIENEYLDLSKSGKVEIGMDVEKTKVEFVGPEAEAIETLELLLSIGGTETETNEWKHQINILKNK